MDDRLVCRSASGAVSHWRALCLVAQLCLTLCDTTDYTVHVILQAGILEWVAFPFSRGSSQHLAIDGKVQNGGF